MRLFVIGDSVSQGFMSGAAARPELSYATLLARALGEAPAVPSYPAGGLFAPLETLMYHLVERFGPNINPIEWPLAVHEINAVLDASEDYYERGAGRPVAPAPDGAEYFSNVSSFGFQVADAWLVTPRLCADQVSGRRAARDAYLQGASQSFYRSALHVLNPSKQPRYDDFSQLRWLAERVGNGGVENLVLWLGNNNALGTVLDLEVRQTPGDPAQMAGLDHLTRDAKHWTLWHPADFEADYAELLRRVDAIMRRNPAGIAWKVFLATVPEVTVAPLAKGVGPTTLVRRSDGRTCCYYKYYTYFPFDEEFAHGGGPHLTLSDALHIDRTIAAFNEIIERLAAERNPGGDGGHRYYVVPIGKVLADLAFKRNSGNPPYVLPPAFAHRYPLVNTKYYHADAAGRLRQGGLVGLDGVHPSAIGQGLIAHEFLKVFEEAGLGVGPDALDWDAIFLSDRLYQEPIRLMQELYQHERLAELAVKALARRRL